MKAALAAGIALAALAIAPNAEAAKRGWIYDVAKASGFERVTFVGDDAGGCALYGVCGYSGVVSYKMGGTPKGALYLARSRSGKFEGRAVYKSKGVTTTTVTPPPDQAPSDCTQTIAHKTDTFDLFSRGSHNDRMMFVWHAVGPDFLDTKCTGPNEGAVSDAGVLPQTLFRTRDFFDGTKPAFTFQGSNPFRAGGFSSSIKYRLSYKLKARACSPHCPLPKG